MSEEDLREYLVTKGDATELLFRAYVDPGNKYPTGAPPWEFCSNKEDCCDKLLANDNPAKFFFTYEQSRRFYQRRRGACRTLEVYQPRSPLASVSAGMYYSSGFSKSKMVEIDRAIRNLRVEHKIQN